MTKVSELCSKLEALVVARDAASTELDAALARFKAIDPAVPEEIIVGRAHDIIFLDRQWFRPPWPIQCERRVVEAEGWRAMLADPPLGFSSGQPIPDVVERMRAGLAAAERYEARRSEARRTSGLDAAETAYTTANDAVQDMRRAVIAAPLDTMGDVKLKAHAFAGWMEGEEPDPMLAHLLRSLTDLPATV